MYNGGNFTLRDKYPWWTFGGLFQTSIFGLFKGEPKSQNTGGGGVSDGENILDADTALKVTAVLAAVRAISQACAQVPKLVVEKNYDVDADRFSETKKPDSPYWRLLVERPNEWQTSFEFFEAMTIQACFRGNAFAYINDALPSQPELIPLPTQNVTLYQREDHTVFAKIRVEGAGERIIPYEKLLHLKGPSFGGLLGADIMDYAAGAIGLARTAEQSHRTVVKKRGRVDGIVSNDGVGIKKEDVDKLRASLRDTFGAGGAGGVAFLDGGATFHRIADTAVDQQLIEHRRFQVDEVGRAFGVNSQILNQSADSSSYGSAEQVYLAHKVHCLEPWFTRWEQAVKNTVIGYARKGSKNVYLRFDRSALDLATAKDRAEFIRTGHMTGTLTPNEARGMVGLNPLTEVGADRPLSQLNMRLGYEAPEQEVNPNEAGTQVPALDQPPV